MPPLLPLPSLCAAIFLLLYLSFSNTTLAKRVGKIECYKKTLPPGSKSLSIDGSSSTDQWRFQSEFPSRFPISSISATALASSSICSKFSLMRLALTDFGMTDTLGRVTDQARMTWAGVALVDFVSITPDISTTFKDEDTLPENRVMGQFIQLHVTTRINPFRRNFPTRSYHRYFTSNQTYPIP